MTRVALSFVLLVSLSTRTIAQLPQCDGNHFPMLQMDGSKGGSPSCCQEGIDFFHIAHTTSGNILAHRQWRPACSPTVVRVHQRKSARYAASLISLLIVRTAIATSDRAELILLATSKPTLTQSSKYSNRSQTLNCRY